MVAALLFALALEPSAAGTFSGRDRQLNVTVPRQDAHITIDGILDEEVWSRAAKLTDFSEYSPVDGRPADDATEVLVWYSSTAIYFGIRAHALPGSVHATLANRDRIDSDDAIQIFLNTFNDNRRALMFAVNPFGVQADGTLVEGTGNRGGVLFSALESGREVTDLTPDYVFTSKGRLTTDGYEVEIEIPFKTLRFPPDKVQRWGVNVIRLVQSRGHEDSWTPATRSGASFLAQSGTLEGLTDLRRGLVLDLNPVVTAKSDGAPSSGGAWRYETHSPEFGGNIRWGLTPNLTLAGTLNPDFSQVEADAGQVVFDPRTALFFPEKRPFFLEGAELFSVPNNLIYTRRVIAPVTAAKLTGTTAGTSVAVMSAIDDPTTSASGSDYPVFTIARMQHDLAGQSRIGFVYTDKIDGSYSNLVAAADARLVFGSIYSLQLQGGGSRTHADSGTMTAPIWQAVLTRDGRHFGYRYQLTGVHDDFRADAGFISRGGIIHGNLNHRYTWYGAEQAPLQSWTTGVQVDGIWQYKDVVVGDELLEKKLHFNNNFKFNGGWLAGASLLLEQFAFDQALYADYGLLREGPVDQILPFTGTPYLHNRDYVLTLNTPQFSKFSGSLFYLWGRDENFFEWSAADIVFATYAIDWRPNDKIRISPQYQLQQFRRRTDGSMVGSRTIPRLKVEYQVSRPVFLRFVGEYDARRQDDLRDDSRTELPIVVRDATGTYQRASAFEHNAFRIDCLFSYQPTPGTVFFAGYGSSLTEAESLRFNRLQRTNDGFFLKVSYLFRL
jgi:hypothetical protein